MKKKKQNSSVLTSPHKLRQAAGPKYCPLAPKYCTCTQTQRSDLPTHGLLGPHINDGTLEGPGSV